MPLFGNNYDTSLKPQQAKLNLSVDPYISQQMPFEHGIAAIPPSPYGGGPSEKAQTITDVGNAVTGVANAYGQKKKMDAEKAYQDKLLAALGIGGAGAPAPAATPTAAPPTAMGIAEQDPEMARALQAQSHQRYMNMMAAPSATPATTATTPTGASNFQINGSPIPPTTPAPASAPAAPSSTPVPASSTAASLGLASPAGSPSVASGAVSPIIQSLLQSNTAQGATNGMNLGSGGIVGNLLANLTGTQNKTGAGLALGAGLETVANPATLGMLTSIGA